MSEPAPEPAPRPSRGGGVKSTFTNRIGPLPMWAWVAIVAVILIVWRVYSGKKTAAASSAGTTDTGVPADQVPQFVNQTYVTTTPPPATSVPPARPPVPTPGPVTQPRPQPPPQQTIGQSWTDTGQKWTVHQLAAKLGIPLSNLHPGNAQARKAMSQPNAPMPKGAHFTYTKGGKVVTTPPGTREA